MPHRRPAAARHHPRHPGPARQPGRGRAQSDRPGPGGPAGCAAVRGARQPASDGLCHVHLRLDRPAERRDGLPNRAEPLRILGDRCGYRAAGRPCVAASQHRLRRLRDRHLWRALPGRHPVPHRRRQRPADAVPDDPAGGHHRLELGAQRGQPDDAGRRSDDRDAAVGAAVQFPGRAAAARATARHFCRAPRRGGEQHLWPDRGNGVDDPSAADRIGLRSRLHHVGGAGRGDRGHGAAPGRGIAPR